MNKKSNNRQRQQQINVRVTDEEMQKIDSIVSETSAASRGDLLRSAALNIPIHSHIEKQVAIEISRLKSELSKVGGLIKVAHMIMRDNPGRFEEFMPAFVELDKKLTDQQKQLSTLFGALADPKLLDALAPLLHETNAGDVSKIIKDTIQ